MPARPWRRLHRHCCSSHQCRTVAAASLALSLAGIGLVFSLQVAASHEPGHLSAQATPSSVQLQRHDAVPSPEELAETFATASSLPGDVAQLQRQEEEPPPVELAETFATASHPSGVRLAPTPTMAHVVYSANSAGFYGLLNSMVSVAQSVVPPNKCTIHLVVSKESQGQAHKLLQCFWREVANASAHTEVKMHRIKAGQKSRGGADRAELAANEAYVGLHMDTYVVNASRALWLDADTIVTGDLAPLFLLRMRHALAAVPLNRTQVPTTAYHYLLGVLQRRTDWGERLGRLQVSQYSLGGPIFNAGVYVVDLDRWRTEGFAARCEAWLDKLAGLDTDTVQLPMNLILHGQFDRLDWRWNVDLTQHSFGPKLRRASVLHWVGRRKPWKSDPYVDHLYEAYDVSRRCPALRAPNK